jgi:alanine racemase
VTPLHEPTVDLDITLRPTHLEVDLEQVAANYRAIVAHVAPSEVMPILKANAYGHGLVPVARRLEAEGAPAFGLAYLEEALRLRSHGVRTPILVMGGILGDQIPLYLDHDIALTASSVDKLRAIEACAAQRGQVAKVHLKVDTGMERLGVHWYSCGPLLDEATRCEHVVVEGLFSHLANSDVPDLAHARLQVQRFDEVVAAARQRGLAPRWVHLANSGAVLQLPEARYDLVRPGVMLFGVLPERGVPRTVDVRPALRWVSRVVYFKVVKAGNPVSYGSTWAPAVDTRVVTVPVGYGDGYFRRMSGSAQVLVGGRRLPVVGRICMDQVMVDLGPDGEAYNGDEVVLLGGQGEGPPITAEDLADWAGTIPYEVLTNINTRVPRRYLCAADEPGPEAAAAASPR